MNKITETKIAKMVRWMATHEDEVAKIIDMDIGLSNQDCLNLIIELEQCEQYELIVAFLHAGRFIEPVATIGSNFWRRLAAEGWRTIGTMAAIGQLKETIKDQIQCENESRNDRKTDDPMGGMIE